MAKTRSLNLYDLVGVEIGTPQLDGLASVSAAALRRSEGREAPRGPGFAANARAIRAALDQQQRIAEQSRQRLAQFGLPMATTSPALDRINIALRSRGEGDRRRVARFPYSTPCRLLHDQGVIPGRTLDISAHGFRMSAPHGHNLVTGEECTAEIDGIGRITCMIRHHGRHGINIAFSAPLNGAQRSALAGMLLRLAGEQEYMASRARELALSVTEALDTALRRGQTSFDLLFMNVGGYAPGARPVPDPHPMHGILGATCLAQLSALIEKFDDVLHVALTDRNGLNALIVSREGQPLPACLMEAPPDVMTMRVARFTEQATIQFRPPGRPDEPEEGFLELSSAIMVFGRRWGCARIFTPTPVT